MQVLEKMAAAVRVLGLPEEIVHASRAQMQSITKMQIPTVDHMMDAWEEQIKAPAGSPSEILSLAQPRRFEIAAMSPFQFWIQFTEQ